MKISRRSRFLNNHVDQANNSVKQRANGNTGISDIQSVSSNNHVRRLAKAQDLAQRDLYSVHSNISLDSQMQHSKSLSEGLIAAKFSGMIIKASSAKDAKELTEQERQTTPAVGLAGGLVGASASIATQAIKNAGENNPFEREEEHAKEKEHGKESSATKFYPLRPGSYLSAMVDKEDEQHSSSLIQTQINDKKENRGNKSGVKQDIERADNVANIEEVQSGTLMLLDANEVRFTQKGIRFYKFRRKTGEQYNYAEIVNSMKKDDWIGDPIDVVIMPDGKLTTVDNTRLRAAREAGIKVKANVRGYDTKLPQSFIRRFTHIRKCKNPQTWGDAINSRLNGQGKDFITENPYGSYNSPNFSMLRGK